LSKAGNLKSFNQFFTFFQRGINLKGCFSNKKYSRQADYYKRKWQKFVIFVKYIKIGENTENFKNTRF